MANPGEAAPGQDAIRVVLADDEKLIRSGWATMLSIHPDITVVGEAEDGRQAVALGARADVVLMDIRMPGVDGLAATRELTALAPDTRVVVVTTFEHDQLVWGALRAGAAGFVLKRSPVETLVNAIRVAHARESVLFPDAVRRIAARHAHAAAPRSAVDLTARESDVLRLLARGLSNGEIAAALVVSRETVKTHVRNLLAKLQARDRTQAVVRAYELGLVFSGTADDHLGVEFR